MALPQGTSFAEATAVKRLSSHTYSANFFDDWCIGTVPHGGYVTACFMQVATAHFKTTLAAQNQPHTAILHLDFVRRTQEGSVLFTVRDVKIGRQTSVIHVTLSQEGKEEVVGYITNMNMTEEKGISLQTDWTLNPPSPPVDLKKLALDQDENWGRQKNMPFTKFRKASNRLEWHFPKNGQISRNTADEWVRLSSGEKWTNESLGYIADMFPSVFESLYNQENPYDLKSKGKQHQARFWYPTLTLNLDIKKPLPEEGVEWLFQRVTTKQIKNGRYDLELSIWDDRGDIIALSYHTCLALGVERNITRSKSKI